MTTTSECLACFVRQAVEAVGFCMPDEGSRVPILRRLLADLSTADWQLSPVGIAQHLHRRIRQATGDADPYRALKERMNRLTLDMLPGMSQDARVEEDPHMAIVRLFFLLRVKCPFVAAQVGAKEKDMVVLERNGEGAP
jgi:uncharacterized protein with ATP-grasp and redox domains